MKNISKNLFLILTGVCAIALVVFLVQLIVINSGTEPEEPDSVIAGTPGDIDDDEEEEPGPFGPEGYIPPPAERPPPQGTRREIPVDTSGTTLIIYSNDDVFDYTENDIDWCFDYKGGGSASLEICHVYISSQNAGADAEAFLNDRIEGGGAEYKGQQDIIDSDMKGYSVQAKSGGITYEAWLYRLPGSDLALAFLINYEFNGQRDDLYTVLSSMSME